MKKNSIFSNDNEPDTMIPLGLAALELLNRLRSKMDLLDLMDGEEENDKIKNSDPPVTGGRGAHDQKPHKIRHEVSELLPRKQEKRL